MKKETPLERDVEEHAEEIEIAETEYNTHICPLENEKSLNGN